MSPIVDYLFKVTCCSGLLALYYRSFLYNRHFHQWNRWFILLSLPVSAALPLLRLHVLPVLTASEVRPIRLLGLSRSFQPFADGEAGAADSAGFSVGAMLYALIALALLLLTAVAMVRVWLLVRRFGIQWREGYRLVVSREKNAPFAFFRYIIWNKDLDIRSVPGAAIFKHEQVHVRQWHSLDRLVFNLATAMFWCNPFFWLLQRELRLVHEFIADAESLKGRGTAELSDMLLATTFPRHRFGTTSHFSSSCLKRRFFMIQHSSRKGRGLLGRVTLLPVLFALLAAFSFTTRKLPEGRATAHSRIVRGPVKKVFTILIDAGHGGSDAGAVAADGTEEKDLVLAIARQIERQSKDNDQLRVVLTRSGDNLPALNDRVNRAISEHADAFVSLHLNSASAAASGIDMYVSRKSTGYLPQARLLGSLVSFELQKLRNVAPELQQRTETGIWVLDAPGITYPSLVVECGNMNNAGDLEFLKRSDSQAKIAAHILQALRSFTDAVSR